jgi:hypothetical protein
LILGAVAVLVWLIQGVFARWWRRQREAMAAAIADALDPAGVPDPDVYDQEADDLGADALPGGPGWYDHDELMSDEERAAEREWMAEWIGPLRVPGGTD